MDTNTIRFLESRYGMGTLHLDRHSWEAGWVERLHPMSQIVREECSSIRGDNNANQLYGRGTPHDCVPGKVYYSRDVETFVEYRNVIRHGSQETRPPSPCFPGLSASSRPMEVL
jgi:hypothetical protein